jgi:prepilin-type N-terminal cleavage/methylation domain-containing protein
VTDVDGGRDFDEGFTLVEVLVALIVLGVGVAALLGALGMQAKTSLGNRNQSQAATTLAAAAEYVKSLAWSAACAGASVDIGAAVPHATGFTVSYAQQQFGSTPCTSLVVAHVTGTGNGYDLAVDLFKRPSVGP